jgi:hypothetical protein
MFSGSELNLSFLQPFKTSGARKMRKRRFFILRLTDVYAVGPRKSSSAAPDIKKHGEFAG